MSKPIKLIDAFDSFIYTYTTMIKEKIINYDELLNHRTTLIIISRV